MGVVGLDLSITATGIAFGTGGCTTVKYVKDCTGDFRLMAIQHAVALAVANDVKLVVIEDLPTHAHGAGTTGMVQGVVRTLLMHSEIPYALVPPASLKRYATGRGNATKGDLRMALYKRTGLDLVDDNQVDAMWLRAMGMEQLGMAHLDLPILQRSALDGVKWPA